MSDQNVEFPALTLPALLRRAAGRSPDAIAVRDARSALTYADLDAEIHRTAWYLKEQGVEPGVHVAVSLPRGVDAVVTQAALFTLGAVYVPVDASYPAELLTSMITDVDARFLIASTGQVITSPATRIDLDDHAVRRQIATRSAELLDRDPQLGDVAYVIHTSGTSGRPKPVAVSHRAIANSTQARLHRYPERVTGFALISPMTFDSSLAGIWWTLLSGGELRLLSPGTSDAVTELAEALTSGDVSHTLLTPSLHRILLSTVDRPSDVLRRVVVAGEACPQELVAEHHRVLPDVELVNEYGPTEAAVWCSSATLGPGADVVVGTPIANTELWIVDENGQVAEAGELGEVGVAGANLANGYLNDPELTAARFVPHPRDRSRLVYRTGDLGRWRADGQLELRGRLDEQIKVRGYRVEPDGVAAALREHPGVRDAVVVAGNGLVAYVVPEWDERTAADELRDRWTGVVDDLDHHDERSGWTSSYTGEQLSEADMAEWVATTVALAEEHDPRSVLELGCGTGQLLTRLAPGRARVVGLDVSRPTLDALAERLIAAGLHHVDLRHGDATETAGLTGFDLVLCNSVTQYFPGEAYLADVVTRALHAGRRVVFGDIRDLALQDAFHAAVVLANAPDDAPVTRLREQWRKRVERDPQLLVDPRWFTSAITGRHVDIRPRGGERRNEMNDFRFDVVVSDGPATEIANWHEWPGDLDGLHTLLIGDTPVGLQRIPNRRTAGACAVRAQLAGTGDLTVADLRRLADDAELVAVHPAEISALAEELGWTVRFSRAAGWPDGEFDAVFLRPGDDTLICWPQPQSGGDLINAPVHRHVITSATENLLPDVRGHAATTLAEHERPATYVVLTELPLTGHGKVDRAALPAPSAARPALSTPYERPVRPIEIRIAEILADLLGIDRVGRHDDFVELGGDSLLAVRAAVRLGDHFGVALPVRTVFDAPTVDGLAQVIATAPRTAAAPAAVDTGSTKLPLSVPQMLLWGHDLQLDRGVVPGPACTLSINYRITGPLDEDALSRAVDELVRRHEALRVTLSFDGGPLEAFQVVNEPPKNVLRKENADRMDATDALVRLQRATPLNPAEGRVFATELITSSDVEHLLALRMHHMIADGCAVEVVERDLTALYNGIELPEAPNYRSVLARQPAAPGPDDLPYWTEKIAGCRPAVLVPPAHLETVTEPHSTQVRSLVLPAEQAQPFLTFVRGQKITLYSALYTVLVSLMAADTGDPEVRLISVNGARRDADLERTAGIFLDGVLLRHETKPGQSIRQAFADAGATVRDALRHDGIPLLGLTQLLPDMEAAFGLSQSLVFEVLGEPYSLRLDGCDVRRSDYFMEDFAGEVFQIPCQLCVIGRQEGDEIRLIGMYDPAYVPSSYVDGLLERMRDVVVASTEDVSAPLDGVVEADAWMLSLQDNA
ncbi:amino acid adenylation domain-containing protein [Lentzea tibetensis]|uniref:Amino acid adenylation domain-containing protein n=1 Tax=Lentzea tibetensis TaxID=2591470 RepID=A0A563F320_9PSEU|nr:non-ribosomal peptide synthetase [Lentzea tibetensis]TWP54158.1 amino acid adenylation domain-containing protein [Lentzea tibetensis]